MPPADVYKPFSTVSPTQAKTPFVGVQSPDVRFSQSIGQALSDLGERVYRTLGNSQIQVGAALAHMGDTFEHVGDDLFRRASAIKAVENETAAIEAETKFRIDADQRTDAFRDQTKASGAVGSLEAHMKGLEDSRQQIRATLPNDQARHFYDNHSLRALGTQMARAGDHAATQGKAAALAAANAKLQLDLVEIEKNPNNPDFDQMVDAARQTYRDKIAVLQGDVGDVAKLKELKIASDYYESKVKGIARTNPIAAKDMMDKLIAEGKLIPKDREQIERTIQTKQTTIASSNISHKVNEDMDQHKTPAEWQSEKSEGERVADARKLAEADPILGKNVEFVDFVGKAAAAEYRAKMHQRADIVKKAEMGVQGVILGRKSPDGKTRPRTFAEARAMGGDEFDANFAMMDYKQQNKYRDIIQSGDHLETEENFRDYQAWRGKSTGDENDIQDVMKENFFEKAWPMKFIDDMYKRQTNILKGEGKSIHLKHAETVTDPKLPPNFKQDDPDGYNRWKGFLEDFIMGYQAKVGHPPEDKVLVEAAKNFMVKESRGWFRRGRFMFEPPAAAIEEGKARGLSEQEVREEYAKGLVPGLYKKLYERDLPKEPGGPARKFMRQYGSPQ